MKPEDIYDKHRKASTSFPTSSKLSKYPQEIVAADRAEAKLGRTNPLPHDPLMGLAESEEINLALTAFCYLVRRLTVSLHTFETR